MAKFIRIDSDTFLGYNYLTKEFFINNKNTITYRTQASEIRKVLLILAPNDTVHTVEWLNNYAEQLEPLTSLAYTIYDTGAYIATVQINSYSDYPLTLNPEKKKLYIMNTNIIFDLTLSQSRSSRVQIIQAYYKEHLGLDLTIQELSAIYDFLISYYKPHVYNSISDIATTPLCYSNIFACSNYTGQEKSVYQAELNPNQEFTYSTIASITNADSATNTITLSGVIPSSLKEGDTIKITNATTVLDTYTYTADGEYTIASLDIANNTIITKEALTGSYTYNYPIASLVSSSVNITNIYRDTSTIVLTELVPNTIQVGDIIYISGTQQTIEGETISCDGEYVVGSINSNTITVQEQPNTNYTYSDGAYPTISKRNTIGKVYSISETADTNVYNIQLTNTPQQSLSENAHIVVTYNNTETYYTINSIEESSILCAYMSGTLTSYEVDYPLLQVPVPYTNILLSVTSTTNKEVMPLGEFMLDNFEQCIDYLNLLTGNTLPTESVYAQIGAEVGQEEVTIVEGIPTSFLGLFTAVYPNKEM